MHKGVGFLLTSSFTCIMACCSQSPPHTTLSCPCSLLNSPLFQSGVCVLTHKSLHSTCEEESVLFSPPSLSIQGKIQGHSFSSKLRCDLTTLKWKYCSKPYFYHKAFNLIYRLRHLISSWSNSRSKLKFLMSFWALVSLKVTWAQYMGNHQTIWCLVPVWLLDSKSRVASLTVSRSSWEQARGFAP